MLLPNVNMNKLKTDNMWIMYNVYGIEVAR